MPVYHAFPVSFALFDVREPLISDLHLFFRREHKALDDLIKFTGNEQGNKVWARYSSNNPDEASASVANREQAQDIMWERKPIAPANDSAEPLSNLKRDVSSIRANVTRVFSEADSSRSSRRSPESGMWSKLDKRSAPRRLLGDPLPKFNL